MSHHTTAEDPKTIEKNLARIEKQDTHLVQGVEKDIKNLEKKVTKLTKSSTKDDKNVTKATAYESKTAKKASQATIAHEKAAVDLRSKTEAANLTKRDRDSTSQLLDSKRRELENATATKRQHDEQAAIKRADLTHASGTDATGKTGVNA